MKQTIRTKNYNAVIQIPYQKLTRKSNCIPYETSKPEQDSSGKTLVISNCNGCCQPVPVKENNVSMQMLEELEQAFESDMREKDERIGVLGKDIDKLRLQLTVNMGQKQKYKGEYEKCRGQLTEEQTKYLQAVKHIKYLDEQIVKLRISNRDKDNVISQMQLKQQKLLVRIGELEQKLVFYEGRQKLLEGNIASLENIVRNKDIEIESKLKFEKQNQMLNRAVIQYLDKISHLEQAIEGFEVGERKLKQVIVGKDEEIGKLHRVIDEYQYKLKNKSSQCEQKQRKIDSLFQKIYENEDTITLLTQKLSRTQQMYSTYTQLELDYKYSIQKISDNELYINSLLQQIVEKKNRIIDLETLILKKEDQIKAKDNPKMYEVKIEKVIDRQDYITKLQHELESIRRAGLDLTARIKDLEGLLVDKDKLLNDYNERMQQLQEKILKLTKYIQQKQRSFAWVVEREIGKDIQLNKNEINRTYKVYPSEPKSPSSLNYTHEQQQSAEISQQRSSYDNIIIQPKIDSVNILTEIEHNVHQFQRIIDREQQR